MSTHSREFISIVRPATVPLNDFFEGLHDKLGKLSDTA